MMIITCVFLFYFQDDYFYILLSWCYNHGPLERENTEHSHVFACCTPPTAGKIKPIIWSLYIDTTACSLFLFVGDACFRWLLTLKRHPNYFFFLSCFNDLPFGIRCKMKLLHTRYNFRAWWSTCFYVRHELLICHAWPAMNLYGSPLVSIPFRVFFVIHFCRHEKCLVTTEWQLLFRSFFQFHLAVS